MTEKYVHPGCRRFVIGIVAVTVTMLLCIGGVTVALDSLCYQGLTQRLPIYPGSNIVFEQHSGLRAFGNGETLMIIEAPDPYDTVSEWYSRNAGGVVRRMQQNGQQMLISLTSAQWSLSSLGDGKGTQVTLNGVCGA
jgi:hypothetical protein